MWVGFVSDDPRLQVGDASEITGGQKRVLYAKAQYIRIKKQFENSTGGPDPYISEK